MKKIKEKIFLCKSDDRGKRLDIFLIERIKINRSEAQKLIRKNLVLVNNAIPKKFGQFLREGDEIKVKKDGDKKKIEIEVPIIKETDDYLIINKPAGLLVQQTNANEPNTLTTWLMENYKKIKNIGEDKKRPGIVHRLDKDASGVMVIAKTQPMFECLKEQFKARVIDKEYNILVHGAVGKDHDVINFEIDRGVGGRMAARPKIDLTKLKNVGKQKAGREALTEFWVIKRFTRFSLLRVKIHTGRTHQIRVHMLSYNHPVVGDTLYYNKKLNLKKDEELGRLFLHAKKLCFADLAGIKVCFESELSKELSAFLEKLN